VIPLETLDVELGVSHIPDGFRGRVVRRWEAAQPEADEGEPAPIVPRDP